MNQTRITVDLNKGSCNYSDPMPLWSSSDSFNHNHWRDWRDTIMDIWERSNLWIEAEVMCFPRKVREKLWAGESSSKVEIQGWVQTLRKEKRIRYHSNVRERKEEAQLSFTSSNKVGHNTDWAYKTRLFIPGDWLAIKAQAIYYSLQGSYSFLFLTGIIIREEKKYRRDHNKGRKKYRGKRQSPTPISGKDRKEISVKELVWSIHKVALAISMSFSVVKKGKESEKREALSR